MSRFVSSPCRKPPVPGVVRPPPLRKFHARAQRDQYRHGLANGRAVGDVAAQGAGVADRWGRRSVRQQSARVGQCAASAARPL